VTNRSKDKGTAWESRVVEHLRLWGWPHAERRALNGNLDKGDVSGLPGVCIEAKAQTRLEIPAWLRELDAEVLNSAASVGFLWIKQRGKTGAHDGIVVMRPDQALSLLREAGYQ
jgi:hypothetical protein